MVTSHNNRPVLVRDRRVLVRDRRVPLGRTGRGIGGSLGTPSYERTADAERMPHHLDALGGTRGGGSYARR